jgi:LL-diaminopimelate aminotransferase
MIKSVILDKADRLYHFPLDLEDYFPKRIKRAEEKRLPLIDVGHFRWPVVDYKDTLTHRQIDRATESDMTRLKKSIADWLLTTYDLRIDPTREIYIGQGIRRIIFDICLAYVEYGDIVLCPEPGIPFYKRMVISVGGVPVTYPISDKTEYKPSFRQLTSKLGKATKILIMNNPHNPLGTVLDDTDLNELIRIASRENIFIINDAAYSAMAQEKYVPLMSIRGSRKVGLEIFSLPFSLGLPYVPCGFAIGAAEIINGLKTIGDTLGLHLPVYWVDYACQAIENFPGDDIKKIRKHINQSRVEAHRLADKAGWEVLSGNSAPFIWTTIPRRRQSATYAATLFRRRRILVLPGNAFGETGEGYLRLSLTASAENYKEAIDRISKKLTLRRKKRE